MEYLLNDEDIVDIEDEELLKQMEQDANDYINNEPYRKAVEERLRKQYEEYLKQEQQKFEERRKKHYIPPNESPDEEYRTVLENPRYEVSNLGNIRNKETGWNLKPQLTNTGYHRVCLTNDDGSHHSYQVHRLAAHAFFNQDDIQGLEVNHKDGNKINNDIDNLEWVTPSENVRHAFETGLIKITEETGRKHKEIFRKIYPPVKCLENGKVYPDAGVAARDLNCSQLEIRRVTRGVYKSHRGYHFELADWSEINVRE